MLLIHLGTRCYYIIDDRSGCNPITGNRTQRHSVVVDVEPAGRPRIPNLKFLGGDGRPYDSSTLNFTQSAQRVARLGGENPQNRPLSNVKTGVYDTRIMPLIKPVDYYLRHTRLIVLTRVCL